MHDRPGDISKPDDMWTAFAVRNDIAEAVLDVGGNVIVESWVETPDADKSGLAVSFVPDDGVEHCYYVSVERLPDMREPVDLDVADADYYPPDDGKTECG